jgi:hypothetical protein
MSGFFNDNVTMGMLKNAINLKALPKGSKQPPKISMLGFGLPGGQPPGGLIGGGGGTYGGTGMEGGSTRGRSRRVLRRAFGRFKPRNNMNGGFRIAPVTFGGVAVPSQIVGEYRDLEPGNPEYNVASAYLDPPVGVGVKIFKNGATYMGVAVVPEADVALAGGMTMEAYFFNMNPTLLMTMGMNVATTIQELFSLPYNLIIASGDGGDGQPRAADSQVFFPLEKNERIITPFRQAYNAGDVAGTVDQRTLEPASNQVNGIAPVNSLRKYERSRGAASGGKSLFTGNPRYVYDSSDYIRYRKLLAKNKNYNDVSFGGDQSNASQTAIMRHF